ncbi:type II secretion system protein [Kineococcus sp. NPDC059986]|uniref:type II secretion system protein n=1 Tax=Kineococcus sp. NPDC059986 TaxID=3155538 RepID=UPI00344F3471
MRRFLRQRRDAGDRDAGFSLIELIVAMGILATCFAIVGSGLMLMFRSANRAQAVADASDESRRAASQLELQATYADAVNFPGVVNRDWFIELRTPGTEDQPPMCHQWRYDVDGGRVDVREWIATGAPGGTWQRLATDLSSDAALLTDATRRPFSMSPATYDATVLANGNLANPNGTQRQAISVLLQGATSAATGAADGGASNLQLSARWTAMNSGPTSYGNRGSQAAGSSSPVCSPAQSRN